MRPAAFAALAVRSLAVATRLAEPLLEALLAGSRRTARRRAVRLFATSAMPLAAMPSRAGAAFPLLAPVAWSCPLPAPPTRLMSVAWPVLEAPGAPDEDRLRRLRRLRGSRLAVRLGGSGELACGRFGCRRLARNLTLVDCAFGGRAGGLCASLARDLLDSFDFGDAVIDRNGLYLRGLAFGLGL